MLDQSGSIGTFNHGIALRFLHDVSSFFNVSANETQVKMGRGKEPDKIELLQASLSVQLLFLLQSNVVIHKKQCSVV